MGIDAEPAFDAARNEQNVMRLTNKLNLPAPLVAAIANDKYEGDTVSDYSTTGLLKPPRIAQLMREHREEMTEDASDRIWALFGQVVHSIIERAAVSELVEKRLFMEINGKTVSGQIDLWKGDTLWDWKTTSIYSGKDGPKDEWTFQGNINRLLCAENGIEVRRIQYVALYRDWSIMAAHRKGEDYPQSQVEIFDLPIWPLEKSRAFVEERIAAHESAKTELPLCTDEERWMRPEKWALMKKGAKRAVKLYDTEEQAETAKQNAEAGDFKKYRVEHRPGENVRCIYYCPVSAYCTQLRELVQP
jgi:hypothetical protein